MFALDHWPAVAGIEAGAVFRPVDRHGHVASERLLGEAAAFVVRERVAAAGMDPTGLELGAGTCCIGQFQGGDGCHGRSAPGAEKIGDLRACQPLSNSLKISAGQFSLNSGRMPTFIGGDTTLTIG